MNLDGLEAVAKSVRLLSMDAIEKAKSGHPGLPLGCAELGSYIFGEVLNHYPAESSWLNRDRFILSAGHGSMLLYSLLCMSGYKLSVDDLKEFRQFKSKTPGHPEYGWTDGVETSTGPLGQGVGNAVGMAIAGKRMAQKYNRQGYEIFNNKIVVVAGDGDLMEGVSYEACSIAGHLKLNNLVMIYDSNEITIEGATDITFTEDTEKRFEAMGWHAIEIDGHNYEEIEKAFKEADKVRLAENKPVIIIAKTKIGKDAPTLEGQNKCHGAPLGAEEIAAYKECIGLGKDQDFYIYPEALDYFKGKNEGWKKDYEAWQAAFDKWAAEYPELKNDLDLNLKREISDEAFKNLPNFTPGEMIATRKAANKVLNDICHELDFIVSGSADLASSTMTLIKGQDELTAEDYTRHNIQYGVREHAMGAICNGLYLYGGVLPIAGTFLAFSTYMRPAIRMAALMRIPITFIYSHDSIFVGEDGPTHHPVEHLSELRIIPNLNVMRPADANETKAAWKLALQSRKTPSIIITTRQNVPALDFNVEERYEEIAKGGYILKKESGSKPDLIIIASGSEISISLKAAEKLEKEGHSVRVVNMFSTFLFDKQDSDYKKSVLPPEVTKRLAVEAGADALWYKYIGLEGETITINKFGISAPAQALSEHYKLTPEGVYEKGSEMLKK